MTAEYIAAKFSLLPRFKVERLERESGDSATTSIALIGRFSKPVGLSDQGSSLYLPDLRSIHGLLLASPGEQETRRFEQDWTTADISDEELLTLDLYYFGAYHLRELYLALDPEILWMEVNFTPRKALQSQITGTDGKSYRKMELYREGDVVPEGSIVVEGAWDHEHCNFCMNRIDAEHIGYTSTTTDWAGDWACAWCYRNAVEPHDPRPLLTPYKDRR